MYLNYFSTVPKMYCGTKMNVQQSVRPKLNVIQNDSKIILEFSMPGVVKENLNLQFKDRLLSLKAKRLVSGKPENFIHQEFDSLNYEHSLMLPDDVDSESIKGEFVNGVLNIKMNRIIKESVQIKVN